METTQTQPLEKNVGRTERYASMALGAALLLTVLRRTLLSVPVALLGVYLWQRGRTGHCYVYDALGIKRDMVSNQKSVIVRRAVTINRPVEEVYSFWHDFENLPRFMEHLKSVTANDGRSHWVAKAPLNRTVEWDAEITAERPNEFIAWRSVEGADVANRGEVRFRPAPADRGTEVDVLLEYDAPAGSLGATVAKLLGEEPDVQVREDLRRFKEVIETGEVPTTEGQPRGNHEAPGI